MGVGAASCGAAASCCGPAGRVAVHPPGTRLEQHFELGEQLADGGSAQVFRCRCRATGAVRACKSARKDPTAGPHSQREEVSILTALQGGLGSGHVVRLFEVFEDSEGLHLVLELLLGGELYERQAEVGVFSDAEAAHHIHNVVLYYTVYSM